MNTKLELIFMKNDIRPSNSALMCSEEHSVDLTNNPRIYFREELLETIQWLSTHVQELSVSDADLKQVEHLNKSVLLRLKRY